MANSTDGSPTGWLNWQTHSTHTYHTNRTEGSGRRTDYDKPNWWVDFCIHRRLQWWLTAADGLTDWGRGGTHCYTFANPEPTLNISRLSNQQSLKRTNTQFKCWDQLQKKKILTYPQIWTVSLTPRQPYSFLLCNLLVTSLVCSFIITLAA